MALKFCGFFEMVVTYRRIQIERFFFNSNVWMEMGTRKRTKTSSVCEKEVSLRKTIIL
jgi:hypothetical protein